MEELIGKKCPFYGFGNLGGRFDPFFIDFNNSLCGVYSDIKSNLKIDCENEGVISDRCNFELDKFSDKIFFPYGLKYKKNQRMKGILFNQWYDCIINGKELEI